MRADFENVLNDFGTQVTITNHVITYSGLYNEPMWVVGSDSLITGLALFQPLGPTDIQVLPQGQVSLFPQKMYVHGSIDLRADSVITENTPSGIAVQYDGSKDDTNNIGTHSFSAQSFIPTSTGSIVGVQLFVSQGSLFDVSGSGLLVGVGSANVSGALIASGLFDGQALNPFPQFLRWTFFQFANPISITSGVQYWVHLRNGSFGTGSNSDQWRWALDDTSPTYADGNYFTNPGSVGWESITGTDANFKIMAVSPREYSVISSQGIQDWTVSGTVIYRKAYVRAQVGSELEYAGQ